MAPPSSFGDTMKTKDSKTAKLYKKKIRRRSKNPPLNHQKKLGPKER